MIMVDELIRWPNAWGQFRSGSCHLTTDGPLEDLHAFAARIGMKRSWSQDHKLMPHYDLTPARRAAAVALGAAEVSGMDQARQRRAARRAAADASHDSDRGRR